MRFSGRILLVTEVQFLGQLADCGGQEPAPEREEYQEAGADHDDTAF